MGLIAALDHARSPQALLLMVENLCDVVDGFKLGLPLLLGLGPSAVERTRERCQAALWIADLKLADIGAIMVKTVETLAGTADIFIAHSFVGYTGALDELKQWLDNHGKKLVLVASMSHPGSSEVYDKSLPAVLHVIQRTKPWGVVAPATRPEIVSLLRRRLGGGYKILSPGVGAQGAEPGSALCAGADYEIVGRMITSASEPRAAAVMVRRRQQEALQRCR